MRVAAAKSVEILAPVFKVNSTELQLAVEKF